MVGVRVQMRILSQSLSFPWALVPGLGGGPSPSAGLGLAAAHHSLRRRGGGIRGITRAYTKPRFCRPPRMSSEEDQPQSWPRVSLMGEGAHDAELGPYENRS